MAFVNANINANSTVIQKSGTPPTGAGGLVLDANFDSIATLLYPITPSGGIGTEGQIPTVSSFGTLTWMDNTFMVNPMAAAGDLIFGGASGTPTRLSITGTGKGPGEILIINSNSSAPRWSSRLVDSSGLDSVVFSARLLIGADGSTTTVNYGAGTPAAVDSANGYDLTTELASLPNTLAVINNLISQVGQLKLILQSYGIVLPDV